MLTTKDITVSKFIEELRALQRTMAHRPLTAAEFRRMVVLAGMTGGPLL